MTTITVMKIGDQWQACERAAKVSALGETPTEALLSLAKELWVQEGKTDRAFWTREELTSIRERATSLAESSKLSPNWRRAYLALADGADRLDAMMARAELKEAYVPGEENH